jgi:4a-hydroxytetrahydrobiopterin dehydratase
MANNTFSPPLNERNCVHRNDFQDRLEGPSLEKYLADVVNWSQEKITDQAFIKKSLAFPNFNKAITAANQIAKLADEQDHHPTLIVEWGQLTIHFWTHSIKGLSENDFIMAARVDELLEN